MREKLGICKVESYWLLQKNYFETMTFKGKIRVYVDSFEEWYNGQLRYRKVDGPAPKLAKKWDMSLRDFAAELGVCDTTAYTAVCDRHVVKSALIDGQVWINRRAFENWYSHQFRYKKVFGEPPGQAYPESMSPHEMCDMLGIPLRNTGYYLTSKGVFKTFMADGQLRIDTASFEKWYLSQSRYKKVQSGKGGKTDGVNR